MNISDVKVSGKSDIYLLMYCRFPPPNTGETVGSELVYTMIKDKVRTKKFEVLGFNRTPKTSGELSVYKILHSIKKIVSLRRAVINIQPKVFYYVPASSISGFLRDYLTIMLIRRWCGKIVAHVRTGGFSNIVMNPVLKPISAQYLSKIDAFVFLAEILNKRCSSILPSSRCVVVPNTIDSAIQFTDEEAEKKIYGRRGRKKVNILYMSNMIYEKGYMDVLSSLKIVEFDFTAWFVGAWGSEGDRMEFESEMDVLGVKNKVKVLNSINDRKELKNILYHTDIFVLPTYYKTEALPRSIIESLNAAVPVVTTSHAGIPEMVSDGEEGVIVKKKSPHSIAAAMEKLYPYEEWKKYSLAARRKYLKEFSPDIVQKKIESVFI